MKSVLVLEMKHESNGFNPIISKREDFDILYREHVFSDMRDNNALSGIIERLSQNNINVIPIMSMNGVPNGLVDKDFFLEIIDEILNICRKISSEKEVSAFVISLHGSMRIDEIGDAEGYLLKVLKDSFKIPIFMALDTHTSMTDLMFDNCDGFAAYKQAPHIDQRETGNLVADIAIDYLNRKILPNKTWIKVPILVAGEKSSTFVQPMKSLTEDLYVLEENEDIYSASYIMGFPWSDNVDSNAGVLVCGKNKEASNKLAIDLAERLWDKRFELKFVTEAYKAGQALDIAVDSILKNSQEIPIYISDSGDNPTAGASGDNTSLLVEILENNNLRKIQKNILYQGIYDTESTNFCKDKKGEKLILKFGAKFDNINSKPLEKEVEVIDFIENFNYKDRIFTNLCLIKINNVYVVLTEKHIGFTDNEIFEAFSIEYEKAAIIVCKLGYLTPEHEEIAKRKILALTRGNTQQDLENIKYKYVGRPIYPLDIDCEFKIENSMRSV